MLYPKVPYIPVPWPGGAQFALFLSHDVDILHQGHFFSQLGLLRRRKLGSFARQLLWPAAAESGFKEILSIEKKLAFRSTFFFLEDKTFSRYGGRYLFSDPHLLKIAAMIQKAGGEIALQGAYNALNNKENYLKEQNSFVKAFGQKAEGVRNHYLRHSGEKSWQAQAEAGFLYDATMGERFKVISPKAPAGPFFPLKNFPYFLAFPLTIMDVALFKQMAGKSYKETVTAAKECCLKVIAAGGVVTLNFHNNYFADPEFSDREALYNDLVHWLAGQKPWNGTGREIALYYRRKIMEISNENT